MESSNAGEEAPAEDAPTEVPRETRGRMVRKNRVLRDQRNRLRAALAVAVGGLVVALGVLLLGRGLDSAEDFEALETELAELKVELKLSQDSLSETMEENAALVQERIPSLHIVEFDKVLEVGERGVRNVTFTVTRNNRGAAYEYKIIVHNDSRQLRRPFINLILFDRLGVEIARSRIGYRKALAAEEDPPLEPGEIRSYSGTFDVDGAEVPAYFRILTG